MPACDPDKALQYERLRLQAIDSGRTTGSLPGISAVVLMRQGMGVWLWLSEAERTVTSTCSVPTQRHQNTLPTPERAELLTVLAGLVFNIHNRKESA